MFQSSLGFLNMWFQIQKITETLVGVMDQVMLDKLANEMERNKLSEENMQLSTALANYLDKFTSPERTKTGYSALVVSPWHQVPYSMKEQGNCICQCVVNHFQSIITCFLWVFQAFASGFEGLSATFSCCGSLVSEHHPCPKGQGKPSLNAWVEVLVLT